MSTDDDDAILPSLNHLPDDLSECILTNLARCPRTLGRVRQTNKELFRHGQAWHEHQRYVLRMLQHAGLHAEPGEDVVFPSGVVDLWWNAKYLTMHCDARGDCLDVFCSKSEAGGFSRVEFVTLDCTHLLSYDVDLLTTVMEKGWMSSVRSFELRMEDDFNSMHAPVVLSELMRAVHHMPLECLLVGSFRCNLKSAGEAVHRLPGLKTLDVSHGVLDHVHDLVVALPETCTVDHVYAAGLRVDILEPHRLTEFVRTVAERMPHLKTLDLSDCGLRDAPFRTFLRLCETHFRELETLRLNEGTAGRSMMDAMGNGALPRLQQLDLYGFDLYDDGLMAIADAAKVGVLRNLTSLDVSETSITQTGFDYFVRALEMGTWASVAVSPPPLACLEHLNVCESNLDVTPLVECLARTPSMLLSLAHLSSLPGTVCRHAATRLAEQRPGIWVG